MLWIIFMLHSHQLPMPLSALSVCPRWCRDTTAGSPCLRGAFTCVNKLSLGSSDMTWEICILSNKDQLWLGLIFQWSALKLISICRPDEFREQMAPWFVLGIHLRVWGTWRGWNMGLFFHLCSDRVLRPCRRSKAFSHPLACASASVQRVVHSWAAMGVPSLLPPTKKVWISNEVIISRPCEAISQTCTSCLFFGTFLGTCHSEAYFELQFV